MTATETKHHRPALRREQAALIVIGIALVAGFALIAVLLWPGPVPIDGGDSVGGGAVVVTFFAGVIAVPIFYVHSPRAKAQHVPRRVLSAVTLTLAVTVTACVLLAGGFAVFQLALPGVQLDIWAAAAVAAITGAIAAYLMVGLAADMTTPKLATLLSIFLLAGVLSAMLEAEESDWWQHNFSSLGISNPDAASSFNFTLVLAGLIVVTLADFLATDLQHWKSAEIPPRRITFIRWWLVLSGVAMLGVGLVPISMGEAIHATIANIMMGTFGVLVAVFPFLVPKLPLTFKIVSFASLGLIGVSAILYFFVHYFNLTAMEFVATIILFAWLTLLVRTVAAAAEDDARHQAATAA